MVINMTDLKKEQMCVGERSTATFSQAYCETDIIVPDVKPDIVKVLQSDAHAVTVNKSCGNNRITVEGRADISILYLGEDNCVYSIGTSQNFSHTADAKGVTDTMTAEVEVNAERTDCTVLNSRKLAVRVLIGIDANAVESVFADLCTEIEGDDDYEVLQTVIRPFTTAVRTSDKFNVKERVDIPSGKPSVSNVLNMTANVTECEISGVENKIIVNGVLAVNTVYMGEMSDNSIQYVKHEIPFVEVMEAEGTEEGMTLDVHLDVENIYYDICEDGDGDPRILEVECIIGAMAKGYKESEINVIEDVYSTECATDVSRETAVVSRLSGEGEKECILKDTIVISADFPEITQVYNVTARPVIGSTEVYDKKVVVKGVMDCRILYLSNNSDSPINSYCKGFDFECEIEADGARRGMVCDVCIDVRHISYNINMGREVEVRVGVKICVKVISEDKLEYITSVSKNDKEELCQDCCIRLYFVKANENLWDVAKHYHTTVDSISKINNIPPDTVLKKGDKILIN